MAGFEPTPADEDLRAQAEAAELAEAMELVKQRRAAAGEDGAVAVIDPSGAEYEVDPETGVSRRDDDGNPVPKWPHDTITIKGREIQIRTPKASALQAFGLGTAKGEPIDAQNLALANLVRKHISPKSYAEIKEWMTDPDIDFDLADFQSLMKEIATRGTGRPTGPSRS